MSFEPIQEAYKHLSAACDRDEHWFCERLAIGSEATSRDIGVSENVVSSSFLAPTNDVLNIHPPIGYSRYETVEVQPLATVLERWTEPGERVHLKLDVQGLEYEILDGAKDILPRFAMIRLESSVTAIYEGEKTMSDMIVYLQSVGFVLVEVMPGWRHPKTRDVLQFDMLFRNASLK